MTDIMNTGVEIILAFLALFYYILESFVLFLIPRSLRTKDISDDLVLVTGAGSGIGRLLAIKFAKLSHKVVIWDVNKEGNLETAKLIKENGGNAYPYVCDLCDKENVYATAARVKKEVGVVTILVNNAGIVTGKPILDCPDNMIQKTFAVNILAHFWTVKAFLPDMLELDRGHIITVASLGGMCGINSLVDYCSSKFAAVGFDETLRMELKVEGRENIFTTVICPYYVNTGMFDGVKSKFLPILSPEKVANEAIQGVLANETMVVIPRWYYIFIVLKMIVPWKAYCRAYDRVTGISTSMYTFRGWTQRVKDDRNDIKEPFTNTK